MEERRVGRPVDDPEVPGLLEKVHPVFADSIHLMADCLDLASTTSFECELGACTEDVDLGWWTPARGSVGGSHLKFMGCRRRARIEVHLEWQMTPHTEPQWNIQGCYVTPIDGDPCITSST